MTWKTIGIAIEPIIEKRKYAMFQLPCTQVVTFCAGMIKGGKAGNMVTYLYWDAMLACGRRLACHQVSPATNKHTLSLLETTYHMMFVFISADWENTAKSLWQA